MLAGEAFEKQILAMRPKSGFKIECFDWIFGNREAF
jgi:hypothetical protein